MSFFAKAESPALNPATPDRRNTYAEAESLPFGNGYFRVAPKWITDRFNDHWSNGKTTGQAYCSVAGVLCHGPIQHVRALYVNGDLTAVLDVSRPTNPADPDYYFTTIEFGGIDADLGITNRVRFYWGDEAQPADSWLISTTGQDHPAYCGQTLVVFERLHCGQISANSQARPSLPNIEFTVYRLPSPSMPAGLRFPSALPGGVAQFRGINLVSAVWDAFTHPRAGLALTGTVLDQADWETKAAGLEAGTKAAAGVYGSEAYVSPLLTGQTDADKFSVDAMAYVDGWLFTEAGKIRLDWFPNDGTTPSPLPEISEHDHVEPPTVRTGSLAEAPTSIVVKLLEGDSGELDLIEAVETAQVPFVRELGAGNKPQNLQRPWFTSRAIGAKYASRTAATATVPTMTGESVVRLDSAVRLDNTPLRIGDIFKVNYAPLSLLVVARLVERLEDETTATLRWDRERGAPELPYTPVTDPRIGYVLPDPPTPGTGDWTVIEAPAGLSETAAAVILAERPSDTLAGLRAYLDLDNDWVTGSTLLGTQGFAAKVTLDTTINSSVTTCILDGTGVDVSAFLGSGVTTVEQDDDTLLLLMGTEWMTIGAVSSAGAGSYNAAIKRGRLQSTAAGHTAAAVGWVIRRDRIALWASTSFTPLSDRHFKIAFYHALADGPLSASKQVTFANRAPNPPTSFAAAALPGAVKLSWTVPTGNNLFGYQIYQNTANTIPGSPSYFVAHAGNVFTVPGLTAGTAYYFWIVSLTDTIGVSTTVGSVTATPTSASAGADGYALALSMPSPQVRCDSAGTPLAGELTTPRLQTTVAVLKGSVALTAVTSVPTAGQFRVLANGAGVSCTGTFSTGYMELDTVSADSGYLPYKVELEGVAVFIAAQWHWVKTLAGTSGRAGDLIAYAFLRQVAAPSTPTGGTYASPVPTSSPTWSDGVPAGSNPLWMTKRKLTVDTVGQDATWSAPALLEGATNSPSNVEVYFSTVVSTPGDPTASPGNWTTTASVSTIWMATRTFTYGTWSGWTVAKIKGETGAASVVAQITGPAQVFTRATSADSFSPATITLSATLTGATATTYAWQHWNGSSWVTTDGTTTGATYLVNHTNFTDARTFRCLINGAYTDEMTIIEVTGGTNARWGYLTNEAHTLPASNAGVVSSWTGASGTFKVYQGDTDVTTSSSFSVIANPDGVTGSSPLIGASTGVYSITGAGSWANATKITTVTFRATYSGVSIDRVLTLTKANEGAQGDPGTNGDPGPGIVYRGVFAASGVNYFHTTTRRDVVLYSGTYYITNNVAKNGLDGSAPNWGTPGGANWTTFGATFSSVATALLLAEDATIINTLTMGNGSTGNGGIFRSAAATNLTTGAGYYMNPRDTLYSNLATFRVGDPASYRLLFNGTDGEVMVKTFTLKPSASGASFVVDTDSTFIGANPPARVTFGTMLASANASAVTTLKFTDGGFLGSAGTGFYLGKSPVYGITYSYGIAFDTGAAKFASVESVGAGSFAALSATSFSLSSTGDVLLGDLIYGRNSGNTYDEFKWTQGTSLDVRGVNIRCLDSSGNVKTVMNQTAGSQGFYVDGVRLIGPRATGWTTTPTGTLTRTGFATSTVTLPELAERVAALINDLHAVGTASHGIIGS